MRRGHMGGSKGFFTTKLDKESRTTVGIQSETPP